MRRCTCSEKTRPSACTTFWRCSVLSEPLPLAECDLSLVLSPLIEPFLLRLRYPCSLDAKRQSRAGPEAGPVARSRDARRGDAPCTGFRAAALRAAPCCRAL